jgi:o-succinylbenzoate synthase
MEEAVTEGLHFRIHRPPPRTTATSHLPVLLLHGWLGTCSSLAPLAADLAARGHTVLAPDLPYHGCSFACAPANPRDASILIVRAVSSLLDRLGFTADAVVIGYSLGGRLALELVCAPKSSLNVAALVLVSSGLPDGSHAQVVAEKHAQSLRGKTHSDAVREWLSNSWYRAPLWGHLHDADGFEALLDERVASLFPSDDGTSARLEAAAAACEKLSAARMTPEISLPESLPVLYVYGQRDDKYCAVAREIDALFESQVEIACVEGAGHNVFVQNFRDASAVVATFASPVALGFASVFFLKIFSVKIYSAELKKEMTVGGETVRFREGALVTLKGRDSSCGVGDIAPLPGLHKESLSSCIDEAISWWGQLATVKHLSISMDDLTEKSSSIFAGLSPATASALGAALTQGVAASNGLNAAELLCVVMKKFTALPARVAYNGVAPRPGPIAMRQTARSRADSSIPLVSGANVLKLKVGFSGTVEDDVSVIRHLQEYCRSEQCTLRLDANCAWTPREFMQFCKLSEEHWKSVEYVEEPFDISSPAELKLFCEGHYSAGACSSPKLGLDESLVKFSIEDTLPMVSTVGVAAVVLKPSMQGSLPRVLSLAKEARAGKVKVVLSSVFDSGVGLAWAAVLASAIEYPSRVAHGLGTFQAIARDSINPSFEDSCVSQKNGSICIQSCVELLRRTASR